ncbi:hypothetical protein Afe04nite_56410 [Asanoa ferruginea]|nr:hypothetical protein Afe04nite_56410 [Asanoa ferruginea]
MPEDGYYSKRPRPDHRKYLIGYLHAREPVSSIDEVDDFRLIVRRATKSDIRVYLTNQYMLGVADVEDILAEAPETTCIVSTMDYNHYSGEAKALAKERGVGLFKTNEFLGAVYHDGQRFLDYLSPSQREALGRQDGSA